MNQTDNRYAPPAARVTDEARVDESTVRYAGFWLRFLAAIIDVILLMAVTMPILMMIYGRGYAFDESRSLIPTGPEILINYIFPLIATIIFWKTRAATPGKMALSLKIVDADTGGPMSTGQAFGRYFAYIPATFALCLGFLWIAFDRRKQGWHDKLAGTLVVRAR